TGDRQLHHFHPAWCREATWAIPSAPCHSERSEESGSARSGPRFLAPLGMTGGSYPDTTSARIHLAGSGLSSIRLFAACQSTTSLKVPSSRLRRSPWSRPPKYWKVFIPASVSSLL